jgi:plastocyanin
MRLVPCLAAAFLLAGCADPGAQDATDDANATVTPPTPPPGAPGPETVAVSLQNNAFEPREVTIAIGDTVRWTHNDGTTPHNVEGDGIEDSHPNCTAAVPGNPLCMNDGDTYDWTFASEGSFDYLCEIHGGMTGTVHVVPAGTQGNATDHARL